MKYTTKKKNEIQQQNEIYHQKKNFFFINLHPFSSFY